MKSNDNLCKAREKLSQSVITMKIMSLQFLGQTPKERGGKKSLLFKALDSIENNNEEIFLYKMCVCGFELDERQKKSFLILDESE